jgi:hypothetical protein
MVFLRPVLSPAMRLRRLVRGIGLFRPVKLTWDVRRTVAHVCDALGWLPRTWQRRVRVGSASTSAHTPMLLMPNYSTSSLGPDWAWHCAPVDEWDGAVPRQYGNPPNCYEWDDDARRSNPSW